MAAKKRPLRLMTAMLLVLAGTGDGRVYHINFTGSDGVGGSWHR